MHSRTVVANAWERVQIRANFALLARDLSNSRRAARLSIGGSGWLGKRSA
jgi:hypothetical protein